LFTSRQPLPPGYRDGRSFSTVMRHVVQRAGQPRAESARQPVRWSRADVVVLSLTVVSLSVCCVLASAKRYLWYDEVISFTLVSDPSLSHMIGSVAAGSEGAPPLYHILLWLWIRLAGRSELALRIPSCAAMIAALILVWITLRQRYTWRATAFGALLAFAMSPLVLYHVAEARYYGVLTALVALAAYLFARAIESDRISWGLFAAIAATHTALVYTHVYGGIYSAAILSAWIFADSCAHRWRPRAYAAIIMAWILFIPWLPEIRNAADLAHPRGWISVPNAGDLVHAYGLVARLPLAFMVFALLTLLSGGAATIAHGERGPASRARVRRSAALAGAIVLAAGGSGWLASLLTHPGAPLDEIMQRAGSGFMVATLVVVVVTVIVRQRGLAAAVAREPLLVLATAILSVPLLAFILSTTVVPILVDRYLLPSVVGISIVLAHAAELVTRAFDRSAAASDPRSTPLAVRIAWGVFFGALLLHPVWTGYTAPTGERPGASLEAIVPAHATVIVPRLLDFMPILRYQRRTDIDYVYPTDSVAAMDPRARGSAIYTYKYVSLLERRGYLVPTRAAGSNPLCTYSDLVVADTVATTWFDIRIASDTGLSVTGLSVESPSRGLDTAKDPPAALVVRARGAGARRPCIQGAERPT
jgi:uncharacterized membrane protein